jgi:hypothetical protein
VILQLNPLIPVTIQQRGKGYAFALIDYGEEHHVIWGVALDDSGEVWWAPNPQVRIRDNWTLGRVSALQPAIKPPATKATPGKVAS